MKSFLQFLNENNPFFKKDIKAGAQMLAQSTPKDFQHDYHASGTASLLGHPVEHHEHVAALGQVLRNPNYETFHHIYTKGNEVVGHTAITNRLPGVVAVAKNEDETESHFAQTREHMKNLGADGYWMLHNHPSGFSAPSDADFALTREYIKNVRGFKGHVIVNHKKFAHISPIDAHIDGHEIHEIDQAKSYDLTQSKMPHEALGKHIGSPEHVAEIAKEFQNPNHATIIGATSRMKVSAIGHIPLHLLHGEDQKSRLEAHARIRKFIKQTGSGSNVMISVPTTKEFKHMRHLVDHGLAHDIVTHNGASIRDVNPAVYPRNDMSLVGQKDYRIHKTHDFKQD